MHVLLRPAVANLGVEVVQATVFDRGEDISRHIGVRRQVFMHFPKSHETVRHQIFSGFPIADIAVCQGDKTGLEFEKQLSEFRGGNAVCLDVCHLKSRLPGTRKYRRTRFRIRPLQNPPPDENQNGSH